MKTNIKEYMELSAYNRAIDHLKDRSISATLREDKKLVVEQVDYERAVKTLDKAHKWGELNFKPVVTTLKEHYDLASVIKRFPKEIKDFKEGGDLHGDLFDALYDYYFDDMPYGTKKARTGDPSEWLGDKVYSIFGDNVKEGSIQGGVWTADPPKPGQPAVKAPSGDPEGAARQRCAHLRHQDARIAQGRLSRGRRSPPAGE